MTDAVTGLLAQAANLPGLLDAAHEAFDCILEVARAAEDTAGSLLPAFALTAAAAADGRDAVLCAPSMPPEDRGRSRPRLVFSTAQAAADYVAALARRLGTLMGAVSAGTAADQAACAAAATCAFSIGQLLAPPG